MKKHSHYQHILGGDKERRTGKTMEDEDNNPFAGTNHLFASGISGVNEDFLRSSVPQLIHNDLAISNDMESSAMAFATEDNHAGFHRSESIQYSINEHPGSNTLAASPQRTGTALDSDYSQDETGIDDEEEESDSDEFPQQQQQQQQQQHFPIMSNEFITITDAGLIRDTKGGRAIAYTIRYNGTEVKRRYSEFDSFRVALIRLFPTFIIPSIPEKHSVIKYFINPLNAKNDVKIIQKRKRMLSQFLNRCLTITTVKESLVWQQFLDPAIDWSKVLSSPPISILPHSNLLAPPLNPTKPSPLHILLPIPHSSTINNFKSREEDKEVDANFRDFEQIFQTYKNYTSGLQKSVKKQKRHFKGLVKDLGELGAYYNAFSLEDNYNLSLGIEKTGQAIDANYLNSEAFAFKILTILEEPITEIHLDSKETLNVLNYRKLKQVQLFIIDTTIKRRKQRIESLRRAQEQSERLEEVLRRNVEQSPTIAAAVKRLEQGKPVNKVSPWTRIFAGRSDTNDISTMNELDRANEVDNLEKELIKLEDCLRVILKDIRDVNTSLEQNIQHLLQYYHNKWKEIMMDYTRSLLVWLRENLQAWEEAKEEIENIQVIKPTTLH